MSLISLMRSRKSRSGFITTTLDPGMNTSRFTHKWSARSTFYQLNQEEILALAIDTSGLEPGTPAFLGALQDATTTLWKNTAKADQDDYVHAAKEWSEKSPPSHIQSRQVGTSIHFIMSSYHCLT